MITMSDKQVLGHFKEGLPPKIEVQLLEIDDINGAMDKPRVFVLFFKLEIPQASGSSVLAYMTDRTDTVQSSQQHNK